MVVKKRVEAMKTLAVPDQGLNMSASVCRMLLAVAVCVPWMSLALAASPVLEPKARCTSGPGSDNRLSNDLAGAIETDPANRMVARVWSRTGYDITPVSATIEAADVRIVVTNPYTPGTKSCPDGSAREVYVALPPPTGDKPYRLSAEIHKGEIALSPHASAKVSSAFDCGGPLSDEVRNAKEKNALVTKTVVDHQRARITVLATYTGGFVIEPMAALKNNVLEVGYEKKSVQGAGVIPACVFSERLTFFVSGLDANAIDVKLIGGDSSEGMFGLAALLVIFVGMGVVSRWQSRRSRKFD